MIINQTKDKYCILPALIMTGVISACLCKKGFRRCG